MNCPSKEHPLIKFKVLVPTIMWNKHFYDNFSDINYKKYTISFPTEFNLLLEEDFISIDIQLFGFGIAYSKQTGY